MSDETVSPAHRAALARHAAGDLEGAAVLLQAAWTEARASAPETAAELASDLAVVLFEAGRTEVAESFLRAEVARDGDPRLHDTLAQVLLGCGRESEAIAAWQQCLALGYDNPELREALDRTTPARAPASATPHPGARLVVPVANDVTCDRSTLARLVGAPDPHRTIVIPWPDPLSRRLATAGHDVFGPGESDLVHHDDDVGPLPDRFAFLEARLDEDGFLRRLRLPGRPRVPTTSAVWDRWLFQIQPLDLRGFVARLPFENASEVELVGGAATISPLPGLVLAAARNHGLPVVGRVVGPVVGRWAPLWLHGCTRLVVGAEEHRRDLSSLGIEVPIEVDPSLDPVRSRTPIRFGSGARDVLVDVHRLSERGTVARHLSQLVESRPEAIRRFVIKAPQDLGEILERVPGRSVGGVPIVVEPGSPLRAARSGHYAVVSIAPYRLLHLGSLPESVQCGVIRGEVLAAQGHLSGSYARLVADAVPEGVA